MYYQDELNKSKNNAFKTYSVIESFFFLLSKLV